MALKINIQAFPEKGLFDFPRIGFNLTREKVEEITKDWNQAQIAQFQIKFPHFVTGSVDVAQPPKTDPKDKI